MEGSMHSVILHNVYLRNVSWTMQKSDIWWKCELQPSSAKPSIWSMRVGLASVYGMKVKAELLQVTGAEINIKIAHSNNVAFFFVYGN